MGQEIKSLAELRELLNSDFLDTFVAYYVAETKNWYAYDPESALPDDGIFIIKNGSRPGAFIALDRSAKVATNPDDIPGTGTPAPKPRLFWVNVASAVQKVWASVPVGEAFGWVRIGGGGAK